MTKNKSIILLEIQYKIKKLKKTSVPHCPEALRYAKL